MSFFSCRFRSSASSMLMLLALAACSRVGGDATQVAVRVNDTEISLSQLQYVVGRQPAVPASSADALARRALERIVDEELAAQGAQKMSLDRDPRIVQALEAAKREVLAKAYYDAVAEKAPLPSSDEVDRYYDSQPALFADRRFYAVQEIALQGSRDELAALQPQIESASDAGRVAEVLREAHLRFTPRQLTVSPEDVPLALLGRLSALHDGQSLMLAQPGGARVLTVLSTSPAPVTREMARPMIQAYLTNERKRQAMHDALKAQRDAAHIEYKGQFAKPAASAASAASAAPG